jgi:3'-5' exoribonuclease
MTKKNSPVQIRDLKSGHSVTGSFIIRKKELKSKKDGEPYLVLELGDSSGRITAHIWDRVSQHDETLHVGDVVAVKGKTLTYHDTLQINVDHIEADKTVKPMDRKRYVPVCPLPVDLMSDHLDKLVDSVRDKDFGPLLKRFFENKAFRQKYQEAPGGKLWHHAYLGGLLEHSLQVAGLCDNAAKDYMDMDRDLLIAGALLHDIGKIEEYRFDEGFIEYSDTGRLHGHISIGAQNVRIAIEKMEKQSEFPEEKKRLLIHLILSHQGELEHGSPVLPQTREAFILYYMDEMDSKVNAIHHVMERDREPDRRWSRYVPVLDRFIYMGE